MQNQNAAIMRKLSDPDFQASLVNRSLGLVTGLSVLLGAFVIHDAWIWTHPPTPKYFIVDGKSAPRAMTAVDSPIVNDAELLDWTVKSRPCAVQRQLPRLSAGTEYSGAAVHDQWLVHLRGKLY